MMQQNIQKVMVVDDDALVRMIAAEALRESGFEVREADDGDTALEMLRAQEDVDLLITDVKMPRMSGYKLAETAMQMRPELKVLLMTGYAQENLPSNMAEAGVGVLYKPFDIDQLSGRAKEILAR